MTERCLLHVEDDENDVNLLKIAFEQVGIANPVHSIQTGSGAIEYLSGTGRFADRQTYPLPCIILLDLKLIGSSGFEVLEWLTQHPSAHRPAVIVFSSSNRQEDIERAYQLGANSFVSKPSDYDKLLHFCECLKSWWLELNRFPPSMAASPKANTPFRPVPPAV